MQFRKSPRYVAGALLVTLTLIITACGGGTTSPAPATGGGAATPAATPAGSPAESPGESPGESPAAAECPPSAEGQRVEMWSPLTGPDGDEMSRLADQYTSENDMGITVAHVAQPEYLQKLEASAAAQQLPAMTVVRVTNVAQLAVRNVLKPFSEEALGVVGHIEADVPEHTWGGGEYNGQRYSVPLDVHPLVMYYNKDMFEAAGLDEPGTEPMSAEDFEAALTALEESGVMPISVGTAFNGATLFQTLIVQYGGSITNADGTQATYNSQQGVQAMEYVNGLRQRSPDVSGPGDPEVNEVKQGNAAIVFHGPWHISDLSTLDFIGFAPFPQIGDTYAVWGGSHQLGMTSEDPAVQAAAACWTAWLSDNSVEWAAAGQVPVRVAARESPDLETKAPAIAAVAEASADAAIILPQVAALEGALWDEFGPVVDGVLLGEVTDIPGALNEAQARSQQKLEENAEQFAP
jgi:multiple sugar transport system substrate-binding protein